MAKTEEKLIKRHNKEHLCIKIVDNNLRKFASSPCPTTILQQKDFHSDGQTIHCKIDLQDNYMLTDFSCNKFDESTKESCRDKNKNIYNDALSFLKNRSLCNNIYSLKIFIKNKSYYGKAKVIE